MMAKLAGLIDCCHETKKSQFKIKESRFKKTEIRNKEIIQNEFQTIQKKKRKIGLDKIQIGDARNKRTTDRKWLTNNRHIHNVQYQTVSAAIRATRDKPACIVTYLHLKP